MIPTIFYAFIYSKFSFIYMDALIKKFQSIIFHRITDRACLFEDFSGSGASFSHSFLHIIAIKLSLKLLL